MCVAGRELTEPKLSPDGSYVAFVATMGGSSAIVVVAAAGGPERVLTTLPPPAAGRGFGGGCFDWLPDGSGVVYAAVGGDLWLHSIAGRAVHAPHPPRSGRSRRSSDGRPRRELRRLRRRPGRGVAVLDRSRPPRRATRRWNGRLLLRPRDHGRRDRRDVDRVERAGHALGCRACRAPHVRRIGDRVGTHGVRRYRRCASAANDAGRIEHHRARRHGLAQCLGRRPPVGRRTVRARRPVVGDGAAVIRRVTRRRSRRLHAQRARLRSDLRGGCPNRRR